MAPKFKIGEPIVVESEYGTKYYIVRGIVRTKGEIIGGWFEYVVEGNNHIFDNEDIRTPTTKELLNYYS